MGQKRRDAVREMGGSHLQGGGAAETPAAGHRQGPSSAHRAAVDGGNRTIAYNNMCSRLR